MTSPCCDTLTLPKHWLQYLCFISCLTSLASKCQRYCTPHRACGDTQRTNTTARDKCRQPICKHFSFSFFNPHFVSTEVSASFKSGTSVRYIFQEAAGNSSSVLPSSVHPETSLRAENISLNFRTSHSPALLLYVSSYRREYLALLLNQHGERQPHEEENPGKTLVAVQYEKINRTVIVFPLK